MSDQEKKRLDQLLVDKYGYESRSRARDAVLRGCVSLGDKQISKPGQPVPVSAELVIRDDGGRYVSRAALKLVKALDTQEIDVAGKIAVDLGASTGGFTQVLTERGAKKVFAIDVGSGQLHNSLQNRPDIISKENLNVRDLTSEDLEETSPQIVTSDLSFISLKLALPPALDLAAPGAVGIFLIKPQFEVGRDGLGSGGIVRDEHLIRSTIDNLTEWLNQRDGWQVRAVLPSPISGGDGNREFLMIAEKDALHV